MHIETMLFSAFTAGFFGSLHCVGMCGGIASALGMSLKETAASSKPIYPALFFQVGRISSYCMAGYIAGSFGDVLTQTDIIKNIGLYLRFFSAIFVIGLGLYLAGWFPFFTLIEKMGVPLWKKISPLSRHLLPVKHLHQAYGLGFLWGWLPCGLTYSILLWSVAAGSGVEGSLLMLVFGLGTIPALLPMTLGVGKVVNMVRNTILRKVTGVLIVIAGLTVIQHSLMMLYSKQDHTSMMTVEEVEDVHHH